MFYFYMVTVLNGFFRFSVSFPFFFWVPGSLKSNRSFDGIEQERLLHCEYFCANWSVCVCVCVGHMEGNAQEMEQKMREAKKKESRKDKNSATRNLLYNDYHRNQRVESSSLVSFISFHFVLVILLCAMRPHLSNTHIMRKKPGSPIPTQKKTSFNNKLP